MVFKHIFDQFAIKMLNYPPLFFLETTDLSLFDFLWQFVTEHRLSLGQNPLQFCAAP